MKIRDLDEREDLYGCLIRFSADGFILGLPHPIIPLSFTLLSRENFGRYVCESPDDYERAREWSQANQAALNAQVDAALAGLEVEASSQYWRFDSGNFADIAVQFAPDEELLSVSTQWISQSKLLGIARYKYPDAISEYSPSWLGQQRIDIYVPSLKIAIEYQGEQHFRPIGAFGGKEGHQRIKKLDRRKQLLCDENGVQLVYWRFDEPITVQHLAKKIGR